MKRKNQFKMTVILKSGYAFKFKCDEMTFKTDEQGNISNYEIYQKGKVCDFPRYIKKKDISAIIQNR